jgi:hypothetical protein
MVDPGGRGSQAPRWLTALGFQAPAATTIGVDLAYASTKFRVPEHYDEPEQLLVFKGPPPDVPDGAVMEIIVGIGPIDWSGASGEPFFHSMVPFHNF